MVNSRRLIVFLLLSLLLGGCGSLVSQGPEGSYITYKVRPGDTLYSISWKYGYDHREVAAWNKIRHPYNIYPGQKILIITSRQTRKTGSGIPESQTKSASRESTQIKGKSSTTLPDVTVAKSSRSDKRVDKQKQAENRKIVWQWPVKGKLITKYNPAAGDKGVDIKGQLGQAVRAAASGNVVYSGKGLIGYGNLIIVKHNETYLSAYGHNRRLLAREGQIVKKGEKIAEMGSTNKDGAILHFEIRKLGKPINPLWYLPK